jgi:hypothetical protein
MEINWLKLALLSVYFHLFLSILTNAQMKSIYVKTISRKQPLSYGVLEFLPSGKSIYLDENGFAEFQVDSDSLIGITSLISLDTFVEINQFKDTIYFFVLDKVYTLDEVRVFSRKLNFKKKVLGTIVYKRVNRFYHNSRGGELAVLIENKKKELCYLSRVKIPIIYGSYGKVRIRVYKNNLSKPGEEITSFNYFKNISKLTTYIEFDLSKENIVCPHEGLFVSIEAVDSYMRDNVLNIGYSFTSEKYDAVTYMRAYSKAWHPMIRRAGLLRVKVVLECEN